MVLQLDTVHRAGHKTRLMASDGIVRSWLLVMLLLLLGLLHAGGPQQVRMLVWRFWYVMCRRNHSRVH